ncbi:MAG: Rab5-interacting family protein [Candidatus Heimdallarchaeota archaeon]|nr:Rab5-interacting family protein [Candidatus Heimdallarchaeota archaeon]
MSTDKLKFTDKVKNSLKPKNILQKIKDMAVMNQVYWSKVVLAFVAGAIFGATHFVKWPAALTMLLLFLGVSTAWLLMYRKKEPGIKIRSYFTSAMFQYFITMIAIWTIIFNITGGVPPSNWFV